MPEAFKNLYNKHLLTSLADQLKVYYPQFDKRGFINEVLDNEWQNKELKQRMRQVTESLRNYLPADYVKTINILRKTSTNFTGFEYMFFPEYVELYGLDDFETSIEALEHFTENASSEFAVRPFIKKYNDKMMKQMMEWAKSDNHHVRRLASEGCRPRLPWAMALPEFKNNPQPVIKILEKLKNDESEYVRRSVANNLNDISKDNPDLVVNIAKRWLGKSSGTDWLVKHGCRTLLKRGDLETLELFGLSKPGHVKVKDFKLPKSVKRGNSCTFSFTLESKKQDLGKLRVEYGIDFLLKNGKQSQKVFKVSESDNTSKSKTIVKSHSFKKITTRTYYPGTHSINIIINGHVLANGKFELK